MTFDNLRGVATPEQQPASSPQKQADVERFKQRIAVLAEQIKAKTDAKRHEKERAERKETAILLADAYIVSLIISLTLTCLVSIAGGKPIVRTEALLCLPLALVFTPTIARLMSRKD